MTHRDLAALAATLPTPVDPRFGVCRAYVTIERSGPDHGQYEPCRHVDRYRVIWALDGGRRQEPTGPAFEKGRDALRLCAILNGEA